MHRGKAEAYLVVSKDKVKCRKHKAHGEGIVEMV